MKTRSSRCDPTISGTVHTRRGLRKLRRVFAKSGDRSLAYEWLRGLARSANQGPFGQAHFVESAVPGESGGACKASAEAPYINDWHSSSSGSWLSAIVEGILGVQTTAAGKISADFCDEAIECRATLSNIPFQGETVSSGQGWEYGCSEDILKQRDA